MITYEKRRFKNRDDGFEQTKTIVDTYMKNLF